ncbi:MAG TPA: GGDEF domain-containing protein [Xanthomonadales bacterium]|nr:GGDEF domain-containing protein [Xanthomonadales bacterium]
MCTLLCCTSVASSDSGSFESLLQQADAVRSADSSKFLALLKDLDAQADQATQLQRQRLRYLHTYRMALAGDFDGAIAELRRLFDETNDVTVKFRAGAFLVNSFAATREFAEGLTYVDRMLELAPQVPDREIRQAGLVSVGVLYNQVGEYAMALHQAELILAEPTSGRTRCIAEYVRLEALFNQGDLAVDDAAIAAQIQRCVEQGETLVAEFSRGYQARKWAAEGRHADAVAVLRKHLAQVEATRYPRLIGEIYSLLAEYELALGDVASAEAHARSAIHYSSAIQFSLPLVMAHRTLYESAMQRKDIAAALDHYRSYAQADKAFLDATKARELAVQLVKQETEQKVQTIELLNKRNQVLHLEQQVSKQAATNTQLLLALALLLLASLSLWAWRARRVQVVLRQLAEIDGLTGISNRRHFTAQARALLARCASTAGSASLIMFDLDFFKAINDEYGHATGDWVLRQVAAVCKPLVGRNDCFGRIGGEEFALVLNGGGVEAGRELALQLRERIAAIDTRENGAPFHVSASFGVTATRLSGFELDRLMAHADEVLYASKNEGRNRVSVYQGAPSAGTAAPAAA